MNHIQRFSIDLVRREASRRAEQSEKSEHREPGTDADSAGGKKSGAGPLPPTRLNYRKAG